MEQELNKTPFNLNYENAGEIKAFLTSLNIAPQKRFGQNFLINKNVKDKIINSLDLKSGEEVFEVGPGLGAMTNLLLQKENIDVKVFEIDRAFINILKNFFEDNPHFSIVEGDVLKTWLDQKPATKPLKILGNLPYNISIAIVQLFILTKFDKAVILVQKEMGERMMSKISSKSYSSFSVFCQNNFTMKNIGILKGGSFYPMPKVDSMLVEIYPKEKIEPSLQNLLDKLAKNAFANRRKTLKNNFTTAIANNLNYLKLDYTEFYELMQQAKIDDTKRAEEITAEKYLHLAMLVKNKISL